jgi:O-acetyl-ADP-ribose deacetylase (regulator of RNase III)
MHIPEGVPSQNCYRAMRAVLRLIDAEPELSGDVFYPGLATGTGRVPPAEAAREIFQTFDDWNPWQASRYRVCWSAIVSG